MSGIPYSLVELEAEFVRAAPNGGIGREDDLAGADGLMFLCPKCYATNGGPVGTHSVLCWFAGRVSSDTKPGPGRWVISGNDLSDLSLTPSVDLSISGCCNWHGFVTNGSAK